MPFGELDIGAPLTACEEVPSEGWSCVLLLLASTFDELVPVPEMIEELVKIALERVLG